MTETQKLPKEVRDLIRLNKLFSRLYWQTGLAGVREDCIQVEKNYFAKTLLPLNPESLRICSRNDKESGCTHNASITIDGIKFFTIGSLGEFEKAGIPIDNIEEDDPAPESNDDIFPF